MDTVLIVPGLYNSSAEHWQSWFERVLPNCVRAEQQDWAAPDLARWAGALRLAAERAQGRIWIVAHSFGCLAVAHLAGQLDLRGGGALLVAPPDPAAFGVGALLPRTALPFGAVLVGSENDPWMSLDRARLWAKRWDATFLNAGKAGHINVASGHGPWPEGLFLLRHLQKSVQRRAGAPAGCPSA